MITFSVEIANGQAEKFKPSREAFSNPSLVVRFRIRWRVKSTVRDRRWPGDRIELTQRPDLETLVERGRSETGSLCVVATLSPRMAAPERLLSCVAANLTRLPPPPNLSGMDRVRVRRVLAAVASTPPIENMVRRFYVPLDRAAVSRLGSADVFGLPSPRRRHGCRPAPPSQTPFGAVRSLPLLPSVDGLVWPERRKKCLLQGTG